MAFRRYANAVVTHPLASQAGWDRVRRAGGGRVASASKNLVAQATEILGGRLDPDRYLLTHATIVCSVDTDSTPNVKLGKVSEGGQTVNRRWGNYLITPNHSKYVNNNGDAWTRPVLMKSYRTFIGAHNFLEHVQVEDLSKGRIIDAVPRDVGESLYIDILVATDRRHTDLVADIESRKLNAMSMGCFLPGTQVSLADGRRIAIEDVVPGEMVLTHKGRAREVVNKQIRHGRWGIRRINAVGVPSEIVATDNHPFFVFRAPDVCGCGCGESLPASKSTRVRSHRRDMTRRFLRGHDKRVFNPKAVYSLDEHRARQERLAEIGRPRLVEVRADELRVGDMLCFPRPSYVGNDAGVSSAHARLLGYFLAEGSFLKHKGDAVGVEFTFALAERDTYAAEVCDLFRQAFPESNPRVYEREDRNTTAVQVSGRDIASWFRAHGGEYCHGKRLSAEAMAWSSDIHLDLIGAWLNGDGTLGKAGQTAGITTSYDLACQMHMLMARCGVFARIEARVGSKSVDVRDVVGGVPVRDEVTGKLPWYTVTVGRLESAALIGRTDKVAPASDQGRMMHVSDEYVQFKVTSVDSDAYTGWVYDMEVDEDHSYVVEGVAVHNCNVEHTTCTKCGNVAVDETEMCEHVRYQKLNKYFDNTGKQRIVAELCGHESEAPTAGVTFIEASWVANPAFTGAVMRNILTMSDVSPDMVRKAQAVLAAPPRQWVVGANTRAANARIAEDPVFDFSSFDEGGDAAPAEGGDAAPAESGGSESADAKPPAKPDAPAGDDLDEPVERLYKELLDRVERRVDDALRGKKAPSPEASTMAPNENLNKEASLARRAAHRVYASAVRDIVSTAATAADVVNRVAMLDRSVGIRTSSMVYRVALIAGATSRYRDETTYISACAGAFGRPPSQTEADALVRIGRILSHHAGVANLRTDKPARSQR